MVENKQYCSICQMDCTEEECCQSEAKLGEDFTLPNRLTLDLNDDIFNHQSLITGEYED
jgi:hypothetical protein